MNTPLDVNVRVTVPLAVDGMLAGAPMMAEKVGARATPSNWKVTVLPTGTAVHGGVKEKLALATIVVALLGAVGAAFRLLHADAIGRAASSA